MATEYKHDEGRRLLLKSLAAIGTCAAIDPAALLADARGALITRRIPSSGEDLPVVGMGSWITFNVGNDPVARDRCAAVMKAFFESGGRLIDSSPMYGSSQSVIGHALRKLGRQPGLFSADKVWTSSGEERDEQIGESARRWNVSRFDLLQVHNLLGWEAHLQPLFAMKRRKALRYVGVTTSHGRRHEDVEKILRVHPVDFVQLTYNPIDREVERRLLPLAAERGIAVIANRPFQQGALIRRVERAPLPGWAKELGCRTWAQAILKWIVSHPAVTCAIPATSLVAHARENMAAAHGTLPDEALRRRIAADLARI